MRKCRYCKKYPLLADVGGNTPYYEIGCKCKDGVVVGSPDRAETIATWNILNERKNEDGRTQDVCENNN